MSVLTVGQVVSLRSGGPHMCILNQAEGEVDCCWLDKNLQYHERRFNVNVLTSIDVELSKLGLPKVGAVVALRSQPNYQMTIVKIDGDKAECIWASPDDTIKSPGQLLVMSCLTSTEMTTKYYDMT